MRVTRTAQNDALPESPNPSKTRPLTFPMGLCESSFDDSSHDIVSVDTTDDNATQDSSISSADREARHPPHPAPHTAVDQYVEWCFKGRSVRTSHLNFDLTQVPTQRFHERNVVYPNLFTLEIQGLNPCRFAWKNSSNARALTNRVDPAAFATTLLQEMRWNSRISSDLSNLSVFCIYNVSLKSCVDQLGEFLSTVSLSLRTLTLSRCSLSSADGIKLVRSLEHHNLALRELDLSHNRLDPRTLHALLNCDGLLHNRLTSLNLSYNDVTNAVSEEGSGVASNIRWMERVVESFHRSPNVSKLQRLNLECAFECREAGAGHALGALLKSGRHGLQELNIRGCFPYEMETSWQLNELLSGIISAPANRPTLSRLMLSVNFVEDESKLALRSKDWLSRLKSLDFEGELLRSTKAATRFFQGCLSSPTFESLKLNEMQWNHTKARCMRIFLKATSSLKSLEIRKNQALTTSLASVLARGFELNSTLEIVRLERSSVSLPLIRGISRNRLIRLQELSLRRMNIPSTKYLGAWLRSRSSGALRVLNLSENPKMFAQTAKRLKNTLLVSAAKHPSLRFLDFNGCAMFAPNSMRVETRGSIRGSRLLELRLADNQIRSFSSLLPLLRQLQHLQLVDLQNNKDLLRVLKPKELKSLSAFALGCVVEWQIRCSESETLVAACMSRALSQLAMTAFCVGITFYRTTVFRALNDACGHDGQDDTKKGILAFLYELNALRAYASFDHAEKDKETW